MDKTVTYQLWIKIIHNNNKFLRECLKINLVNKNMTKKTINCIQNFIICKKKILNFLQKNAKIK